MEKKEKTIQKRKREENNVIGKKHHQRMNTYNIVNFRVAGAKPWIVSCSTGKSFALFAVLQESYTSYYFTIINNDNKREIKIDKREIREREREKERDRIDR